MEAVAASHLTNAGKITTYDAERTAQAMASMVRVANKGDAGWATRNY
jgi:hypothetical protein